MVIDSNMTVSGKISDASMVKLKRGDKVIERKKIDWETNQANFKKRGFSLMEEKPKKKKGKK